MITRFLLTLSLCFVLTDHLPQITAALHFGVPSQLEAVARPQYHLTSPPPLDIASSLVNDLLITIPGVVCAVRAALQDPDDRDKMIAASDRAKQLYYSPHASWIQKTAEATSRPHTSPSHGTSCPTGRTIDFDSVPALLLAARYFLSRLITCGLLQSLASLPLSHSHIPHPLAIAAERGELSAATSIAECLDYALRPNPAAMLIAVGLIMPLEPCVGTWSRVQRREKARGREDSPKARHASEMQEWCLAQLRVLCSRWRAGKIPRENMEQLYDMVVGGPVVPGTYQIQENGEGLS